MIKVTILSTVLMVFSSAFAADGNPAPDSYQQTQAAAMAAFSKPEVAKLVTAATEIHHIDASTKPMISADDNHLIDCNINPKPYGRADKSKCGFVAIKSFGWYADPVLVVTVRGFVTSEKSISGIIQDNDITISEVSIQKPEPTGLE